MRALLWALGGIVALSLVALAIIVVPILTSTPQGSSGQDRDIEGFPTTVSATGDDGRTRTLTATLQGTQDRGLDRLITGDRIVVEGSGYSPGFGIYVAVCAIPESVEDKPGPCLGGVPSTNPDSDATAGVIEYAPSNWINDQWAWRLFGARSFDDRDEGTFRAYIEIPGSSDATVNCIQVSCGLYTRNDHTALEDRVQDIYLPVSFVG
jgi:hypothetical protein